MKEPNEGLRRHKLMPKDLRDSILALYTHDDKPADEVPIAVKFFSPYSGWTWFATEGSPEGENDFRFFGMVHGFEHELGYFMLSELAEAEWKGVPAVERDLYYGEHTLADVS